MDLLARREHGRVELTRKLRKRGAPEEMIEAALERGRIARQTEPRAASARYDRKSSRIIVELTNGCTFAFPPRMAQGLEAAGIPLYAQHVDTMDNATLVDVFRAEENACLLGTDAMRDGVDVPGRSLRLLVFDRVPWPRPSILHRERRVHLSGGDPKGYDDALARHRLRQAFGRLVRRADDRGVFVLLDRSCPGRLLAGLPEGVEVRRLGLAEAVAETRRFLADAPHPTEP